MDEHSDKQPSYKSFWLRCWQSDNRAVSTAAGWRFSLENPESGRKQGFTDLEELFAFLQAEINLVENEHGDK